jgi:hypothetical protein
MRTQDPLDKYLPDEATADAAMNGPTEFKSKADPKLTARLEELNRQSANPAALPPAPASVTAYVPPTPLAEASQDRTTLPRVEPKVELAVPPSRSESPTEPSLKRLEGEPEVPGVVKGPSAYAPKERRASATKGAQPVSTRTAVLATLAVLAPVLMVIAVMGRVMRQPGPSEAASARMEMETAAPVPSVAATAAQPSAAPVTSARAPSAPPSASAVPSASVSAEPSASPPAVGPHKTKPHATVEAPYGDASAPSPRKTAEPVTPPPTPHASAPPVQVAPPSPPTTPKPVATDILP